MYIYYFPESGNYLQKYNISPVGLPGQGLPALTDDAVLVNFINQVHAQRIYGNDPAQILINTTDPIFGTRALMKLASEGIVITYDGSTNLSAEELASALQGLTVIYGISSKAVAGGINLTKESTVIFRNMIDDMRFYRNQVTAARNPVSLSAVKQRAAARWVDEAPIIPRGAKYIQADGRRYSVVGRTRYWDGEDQRIFPPTQHGYDPIAYREGQIPQPLIETTNQAMLNAFRLEFDNNIVNSMRAGLGAVVSRQDVLEPATNNIIRAIQNFQTRTGRNLSVAYGRLRHFVEQGNAYVLDDRYVPGANGYFQPISNYIVFRDSSYFSRRGLHTIHHEITHMSGSGFKARVFYGQPGENNRFLTAIYELMTDAWADIARGVDPFAARSGFQTGAYRTQIYQDIYEIYLSRIKHFPDLWDDCLEFAVTGDGNLFLQRWNTKLGYLRTGIDPSKVRYSAGLTAFLTQFPESEEEGEEMVGGVEPAVEFEDGFFLDEWGDEETTEVEITELEGTSHIKPGDSIFASVLETNGGVLADVGSESWSLQRVVASNPFVKEAHAVEICVNNIAAHETSDGEYSLTIPESTAAGLYTLTACLHRDGSNETLDTASEQITVYAAGFVPDQPDVTPIPSSAPSPTPESGRGLITGPYPDLVIGAAAPISVRPGQSVTFSAPVWNISQICIAANISGPNFYTSFKVIAPPGTPGFDERAVSAPSLCGPAERALGETWILGPGQSWQAPNSPSPGNYFLRVCADVQGNVFEVNEANNCADIPISITSQSTNPVGLPPPQRSVPVVGYGTMTAEAQCIGGQPSVTLSWSGDEDSQAYLDNSNVLQIAQTSNNPSAVGARYFLVNPDDPLYQNVTFGKNITDAYLNRSLTIRGEETQALCAEGSSEQETSCSPLLENTEYGFGIQGIFNTGYIALQQFGANPVLITTPSCSQEQPQPTPNPQECPPLFNFCPSTKSCQFFIQGCQ